MINTEEEILKLREETKKEATDRIGAELRENKMQIEREKVIMNYFFDLTGIPMPLDWVKDYTKTFYNPDTPAGYNLVSFISSKQEEINKLRKQYEKEI